MFVTPADPVAGATDTELARERDYVHGLYERVDALLARARSELDSVRASGTGGTHQNRTERDAFARMYEDRVTQLSGITERLAFGRLEFEPSTDEPIRYIGRLGLRDEDQRPLLLDWRAPGARAFYQATAATPLGVRARRQLQSRGRDVVRIDDEIFDRDLLDSDEVRLHGDAALLASVTQRRTGRMTDIVATIQAEQDRIIRSDLPGVLVVQGGPGTGKTAVALHRAAYLLYTYRDRLAASGVLIVGPSRSFLQYIEAVLPSLGETGVVLASLGQIYPGVEASAVDAPAVAALKGSPEMASLVRRAVRSRQKVPTETQVLDINGERIAIHPDVIRSAMQRAWETRKPHNLARITFNKAALASITRLLVEQLRASGTTIDDADLGYLREDVRTAHDVRVALNTAWLPLSAERFLEDLYARPHWLAELTPRWTPEKRALLRRERGVAFTVADVPLLDEAAEQLGEFDPTAGAGDRELAAQRARDVENAEAAIRNMGVEGLVDARSLAAGFEAAERRGTTAELAAADRSWVYGHVVVDEAQELSPMQWRMLIRRAPHKSFTVVGDIAQASSPGAASSWRQAMEPFGEGWRLEELTVNYRTPAQISRQAESMARANGLVVTPSSAVREGDSPVLVHRVADLARGVVDSVAEDREISREGTLAVIAPDAVVDAVQAALVERFGDLVGRDERGLSRAVAVLTPDVAKGLEFDVVIIVEPAAFLTVDRGVSALYVAMTRATQRVHVVAGEPLPAGLEPPR
jgi:DNA helicase IV